MEGKIWCPGRKLVDLLDVLSDPNEYKRIVIAANQDVELRGEEGTRYMPKNLARLMIRALSHEYLRDRDTFLKLNCYAGVAKEIEDYEGSDNVLMDAGYVLARHVKECREEEHCLDRYFNWLTSSSRKRKIKVDMLDLKTLDIFVR